MSLGIYLARPLSVEWDATADTLHFPFAPCKIFSGSETGSIGGAVGLARVDGGLETHLPFLGVARWKNLQSQSYQSWFTSRIDVELEKQ